MTKREYYDWLHATNKAGLFPSYDGTRFGWAVCRYRGPNGRMCAAGPLVHEDKAKVAEGSGISVCVEAGYATVPVGMTVEDLVRIQGFHDVQATTVAHGDPWDAERFAAAVDAIPCFQEFVGQ